MTGRPITELGEGDCRFPVGREDDTHLFCGEPRRDPRTRYCAEHHKLVWYRPRKLTAAEKKAIQEKRKYLGGVV